MDWSDIQAALHVIQLAKDHPKLQPLANHAMQVLEQQAELLRQGKQPAEEPYVKGHSE